MSMEPLLFQLVSRPRNEMTTTDT